MSPTPFEVITPEGSKCSSEEKSYVDRKDGFSVDLQRLAEDELGETREVRTKYVHALREWVQSQPQLSQCHGVKDAFLLRFLRSKKFDLQKSSHLFEKYVRTRSENPDWLCNLDPTEPSMIKLIDSGHIFALPGRDLAGRRVIVNDITRLDLNADITNQEVMKTMMATLEVLLRDKENQIRGFTYIFYCKNMTLAHCAIWTPSEATRAFGICEKNLPIRHADINMVHLSLAAWAVLEFVKQFLSSKIKGRISAVDNTQKLSDKLGSQVLPKEWGGKVPLIEMPRQWREEVQTHKAYLLSLDSLVLTVSEQEKEEQLACSQSLEKKELKKKERKASGLWSYIPGLR